METGIDKFKVAEKIRALEYDHLELRARQSELLEQIKDYEKGVELALIRRSINEPCKELSSEKKIALVAAETLRNDSDYQTMKKELSITAVTAASTRIEIEFNDNLLKVN